MQGRIVITFCNIAAFISVFHAAPCFGTTYYVKPYGSGDVGTIQAGIDAAAGGDTVLVAPGFYTGAGNHDIDFRGKAIVVMSEAGAPSTIIDCARDSDGWGHQGFHFHSGEDTCSVLKGFTIYCGCSECGGGICCESSSPVITDNILVNNMASYGGGIYCYESECVIMNNLIEHSNLIWNNRFDEGQPLTVDMDELKKYNSAISGGGIYCSHAAPKLVGNIIRYNYAHFLGGGICSSRSSAEIRDNEIFNNHAEAGDGGGISCYYDNTVITRNKIIDNGSEGTGGIHSQNSRLIIEHNDIVKNFGCYGGGGISSNNDVTITIRHNSIVNNGGAVGGSGVSIYNSPAVIEHNTIQDNGSGSGAGLRLVGDSSVVATDNVIRGNKSDYGGGIYCEGSPRIERNIILGNYADYYGGGIYCRNSKSIIRYNIICDNSSMDCGCGIDCYNSSPLIAHNTIADNFCYFSGAGIHCWNNSAPDIRNCIVTGSFSYFIKTAVYGIATYTPYSKLAVSCCDVFGNEGGNYEGFPDQTGRNGNISADPLFCDPGGDDYSLSAVSPCLPGNHPNGCDCGLIGAVGRGCGGPMSTLVRDFGLSIENGAVRLRWTLTAFESPSNLSIHRSVSGKSTFEKIPDPDIAVDDVSYSYTDNGPEPGAVCRYRVYLDADGHGRMLFETDPVQLPRLPLTLLQNYPNPFNPSTTIRYYIPATSRVRLHVYSITGKLIDCVVNKIEERGFHAVEWDGTDREGRTVAAGIYLYILKSRKNSAARKMVLVR